MQQLPTYQLHIRVEICKVDNTLVDFATNVKIDYNKVEIPR